MLQHLYEREEVILYCNLLEIPREEKIAAQLFLQNMYENECWDYPHKAPAFNAEAAAWAAQTVYLAAQLMLYRDNKPGDLQTLMQPYSGEINAGALLSADLFMRFMPDVLVHLKMIEFDDALIGILEGFLKTFHYSGVKYNLNLDELDFNVVIKNDCLTQLYVNRIIKEKKVRLANHPALAPYVKASIGNYRKELFNELVE
ncbi:MAG TPA: hypothetical protein VD905_03805 [Flavobacteriales bacterium]|nr:hypothetical protein [Flavobacteriales bacterium]